MDADEPADTRVYYVVVNEEEQYSIWPKDRKVPDGWQETGVTGAIEVCLQHIEAIWTDMRPLSLRRLMDDGSL